MKYFKDEKTQHPHHAPAPKGMIFVAGVYVPKPKKKKKKRTYGDIRKPLAKRTRSELNTLRNRIMRGIKLNEVHENLGYSANDLKVRLEALFDIGMTFDNMGAWHIDHIMPVARYQETHRDFSEEGFSKVVNRLDNLQPLWARDNAKKHSKY